QVFHRTNRRTKRIFLSESDPQPQRKVQNKPQAAGTGGAFRSSVSNGLGQYCRVLSITCFCKALSASISGYCFLRSSMHVCVASIILVSSSLEFIRLERSLPLSVFTACNAFSSSA